MLSPKEFLLSIGALPCGAAHEAMKLYAEYCIEYMEINKPAPPTGAQTTEG